MTASKMWLMCAGLLVSIVLGGCDYLDKKPSQAPLTYSGCLHSAIAGSRLSVDDIRTLCAEAAQVVEAHYEYTDGAMVPSNEFTRCYDVQLKDFQARKLSDAIRLAKLSCKYPDVK